MIAASALPNGSQTAAMAGIAGSTAPPLPASSHFWMSGSVPLTWSRAATSAGEPRVGLVERHLQVGLGQVVGDELVRERLALTFAGDVERLHADERLGGLAAGERRDRGDVVLDAGLLDVGDGPRAGNEERGLAAGEGGDGVVAGDRAVSAPLPFSPSAAIFLNASTEAGLSTPRSAGS